MPRSDKTINFSVVQWNVNGLQRRMPELCNLVTLHQPTAIVLCETFLQAKNAIHLPGYKTFRLDRTYTGKHTGGGLLTFTRADVGAKIVTPPPYDEDSLCVELSYNNDRITLVSTYDPKGNCDTKKLGVMLANLHSNILFLGDMNAHNAEWGSSNTTSQGKKLMTTLEDADLMLLNTGEPTYLSPTHLTTSAIDISFCSTALFPYFSWRALCFGSSDHYPILICGSDPVAVWNWTRQYWKLDETKWAQFQSLQPGPPTSINSSTDVDFLINYFNEILVTAGKTTFGLGRRPLYKRTGPLWWNADCRRAIAARNKARLKARSSKREDYIYFKKCVAQARKTVSAAKRAAWEHFCTNLTHRDALTEVWKRAKHIKKSWNLAFPTLYKSDGTLAITDLEKATALLEPYNTPHQIDALALSLDNSFPIQNVGPHDLYELPITMLEMENALQTARLGAMGPDMIPYQFLKHLSPEMKLLLLRIFNLCFSKAVIPMAWKDAILLPILKPGKPPDQPTSYRPIALASCPLKTLEKIIAARLTKYLELHNKIPSFQYGFRKGRGCTEALDSLITEIKLGFAKKRVAVCAFMDIQKAFDNTRHEAIRAALRKLDVPLRIYFFCSAYLKGRRLRMTVGASTAIQELHIGVPQGGPLSAHLFSIVMNHIPPYGDTFSKPGLYADDTRLLSVHSDITTAIGQLNHSLRHLQFNAITWGMQFDPTKSRIVVFHPRRQKIDYSNQRVFYAGEIIPIVQSHTFLGLVFDTHLTWRPHIKALTAACTSRLQLIRYVSSKSWGFSKQSLRTLYITLIRSKIQYSLIPIGSTTPGLFHDLEIIQNRALRIILGLPRTTAIASMQVLANMPSLFRFLQSLQMTHTIKQIARNDTPPLTLLLRNMVETWRSSPPPTQIGFSLLRRHDLIHYIHLVEPLPRISPILEWTPQRFSFNTDWLDISKSNIAPELLRIRCQEIIHEIPTTSTIIYTDGSLIPQTYKNGIGIYCPTLKISMRLKMPTGASIFTVELNAIWIAITWAISLRHHELHIISDSLSALTAIKHHNLNSHLIHRLYTLPEHIQISFLWVPSHVGISGNQRADALATQAITDQITPTSGCLPYRDIKRRIDMATQKSWDRSWEIQTTGRALFKIFPSATKVTDLPGLSRTEYTVRNHLACNRAYLPQYLHLIQRKSTPYCDYCQTIGDAEHYLLFCAQFKTQRTHLRTKLTELQLPFTMQALLGGISVPISTHQLVNRALMTFVQDTLGFKTILGYH